MSTVVEQEGRAEFLAQRRRTLLTDLASTLLTIGLAVAIGMVIVGASGQDPFQAVHAILTGPLERPSRIGTWLEVTTTLTLLGLSVAVPFAAGQISIGAEGQLYAGALVAALVALYLPVLPGGSVVAATAAAMVAGALVGAVPGLMKSRLQANEIVATLMLNAVVVQVFAWILRTRLQSPTQTAPVSAAVPDEVAWTRFTDLTGVSFGRANLGLLVAVAACVVIWYVLTRTPFGYQMRVVGSNPTFADYGGIGVPRVIDGSFMLGGALAGLAGAHLTLGVFNRLEPGMGSGLAFLGIVIALLARNNPLLVLLAAAFYAYLQVGGDAMERETTVGAELVVIIQAVIVLLITARTLPLLLRHLGRHLQRRRRS